MHSLKATAFVMQIHHVHQRLVQTGRLTGQCCLHVWTNVIYTEILMWIYL